nr:hypothetical protein [Candidatus Mycoplasma haematolamae]
MLTGAISLNVGGIATYEILRPTLFQSSSDKGNEPIQKAKSSSIELSEGSDSINEDWDIKRDILPLHEGILPAFEEQELNDLPQKEELRKITKGVLVMYKSAQATLEGQAYVGSILSADEYFSGQYNFRQLDAVIIPTPVSKDELLNHFLGSLNNKVELFKILGDKGSPVVFFWNRHTFKTGIDAFRSELQACCAEYKHLLDAIFAVVPDRKR